MAEPSGIKAFSIFGEISLPGAPGIINQLGQFERAGQKAAKALGPLSKEMVILAGGLAAATAAVGIFTATSIRNFAQFEDALTQATAIFPDLDRAMRDKLAGAAREVGRTTVFSARQGAEALFFLASAGLEAEQAISALPVVAQFAQAGMFDLARSTELLGDSVAALGLKSDDARQNMVNMTRVADVLAKANVLSQATVEQFADALTNRAAPALRLVGKDVEEGTAVLAAMAQAGVKGAEAGTRLDIVLRDLQKAALQNKDEFEALGVAVFDGNGEMRHLADILADLEGLFAGVSDEQRRATITALGFQERSVSALLTLLGFSNQIREFDAELRKAGGTAKELSERQMDSLTKQLGLLFANLKDVTIGFGGFISEALHLKDILKGLNAGMSQFGNISKVVLGIWSKSPSLIKSAFEESTDEVIDRLSEQKAFLDTLRRDAAQPTDVALFRVSEGPAGTGQFDLFGQRAEAAREAEGDRTDAAREASRTIRIYTLEDLEIDVQAGRRSLQEFRRRLAEKLAASQNDIERRRELQQKLDQVDQEIFQRSIQRAQARASLELTQGETFTRQVSDAIARSGADAEGQLRLERQRTHLEFLAFLEQQLRRTDLNEQQRLAVEVQAMQVRRQIGDALFQDLEQKRRAESEAHNRFIQEQREREEALRDFRLATGELTLEARLQELKVQAASERAAGLSTLATETETLDIARQLTQGRIEAAKGLAKTNREAATEVLLAWREQLAALGLLFPALEDVIAKALGDVGETAEEETQLIGEKDLFKAGEEFSRFFFRGLTEGFGTFEETLKRLVLQIVESIFIRGVKTLLGILSPSRVAMGFGEQYGMGLVQGLDDQRAHVQAAVHRLVAPLTVPLPTPDFSSQLAAPLEAAQRLASFTGGPRLGTGGGEERPSFDLRLDVSRLPTPRNPIEARRDAEVLHFLAEGLRDLEYAGWRPGTRRKGAR